MLLRQTVINWKAVWLTLSCCAADLLKEYLFDAGWIETAENMCKSGKDKVRNADHMLIDEW